jgi:hypothetical protein
VSATRKPSTVHGRPQDKSLNYVIVADDPEFPDVAKTTLESTPLGTNIDSEQTAFDRARTSKTCSRTFAQARFASWTLRSAFAHHLTNGSEL